MSGLLNSLCLPIITFLVLGIMAIYKRIVRNRGEVLTRLIPVWAALLGTALSIYIFIKFPTLTLAYEVLSAALLGFFVGLSPVGLYQIGSQLSKLKTVDDMTCHNVRQKLNCPKADPSSQNENKEE